MIKASVIIPNYNGERFLKDCLESLNNQTEKEFEVIFVDNNSEDDSINAAKKLMQDIRIISLKKNYGFSRAVNEGIKASKAEYVILLNNDTETDSRFVEILLKEIQKSKRIFSCAAKLVQFNNRDRIDSAGDYYTILGCTFTKGYNKKTQSFNKNDVIFSSCAGAAIYRKSVFDKIGYFDELHFAYLEDVDVGYRAKIHGYRNVFAAQAVVYHVGSGSSGSRHNEFKVRLAARNNVYLNYKNMPIIQLIINLPFILIGIFMKFLYMRKFNLEKVYIHGVIEGLKSVNRCKKVKFMWNNLPNYFKIEYELIANLIKKLGD